MGNTAATEKQLDYIVSLANRVTGDRHRFISQHRNLLGLSTSKAARLSKTEASAIIDELAARLNTEHTTH
jgi:hypothetical protein